MAEGSYIPLTNEALEDFKEYLKNSVAYAEYRSGSTWYKIPIYKVETLPDGRAAIFVMFDHTAPNQITGIRFYHRNGFIFAGGNENLNKEVSKKASFIVIRLNLSSLRANRKE